MRALVVYESMFGCTREVASAVADGLGLLMQVDVVEVGAAPPEIGDAVDLLVVGGPTHAFSMSRARTRVDSLKSPGHVARTTDTGIREWLEHLRVTTAGTAAAAFDTRIDHPRVPGSAARAAHRRLTALRLATIVPPESFWVTATTGPLVAGEPARARAWGAELGRTVVARGPRPGHGVHA